MDLMSIIVGGVAGLSAIILMSSKLFGKDLIDEWYVCRKKYQAQLDEDLVVYKYILSPVAQAYFESIKVLAEKISKKKKQAALKIHKVPGKCWAPCRFC